MTFNEALEQMKIGRRVQRRAWPMSMSLLYDKENEYFVMQYSYVEQKIDYKLATESITAEDWIVC